MTLDSVLAFWGVCALLIAVPGADWAFVVGAGLRGQSVVPAVAGLVLGYAALVARSPVALTMLTLVGGSYLIGRGVMSLARRPEPIACATHTTSATHTTQSAFTTSATSATVVQGLGVSGLNPKGLLLFLALLPQFADRHGSWPLPGQLALLGVVFTLSCGAFYLGLGAFVQAILVSRPWAARALTRVSGAAMIVIGAVLLAERLLA
jgi:threonine/homoserine/homoserine lactone efflux protein